MMSVPGASPDGAANPGEAEVFPAADGLVVYELPWKPGLWVVGFEATGWRIDSSAWPDRDAAIACAEAIEPLADWHAHLIELGGNSELRLQVESATSDLPGRISL